MTKREQAAKPRQFLDSDDFLSRTGQARYRWDVASDVIEWSDNLFDLVGMRHNEAAFRGRGFETMLTGGESQSRFGVVFAGASEGNRDQPVSYQCSYAISGQHTANGEPVWLEDTGIWYPGAKGRPVRAEGVVRVISERRQREEQLRRKSDFDDLTGLPNRRYLELRLANTIDASLETANEAALVLIEISQLDLVNDTYGFSAGDDVLRQAGEIIASKLREDDTLTRFSGAKFGVILAECKGGEVYPAIRRLMDALGDDIVKSEAGPVSLRPVIGACRIPRHARDARSAIAGAITALRSASADKLTQFQVFDPDPVLETARKQDAALAQTVIEAIEGNSLRLAFQPVIEAQTGRIAFHEALIRLEDADGNIVDAHQFVPLAEKLGFVSLIDGIAAELAVDVLSNHPDAVLSLNVSNETLEQPQWLSDIASRLAQNPQAANRLIVEITESHAAGDLEELRKLVHLLKDMGCRVAIDDFGAGFTSFANLKDLPVDIIKIDGSFTQNLGKDRHNQIFIRSLIGLAQAFGAKTVVEWVESEADAIVLREWGVDYLQGDCFGAASIASPWEGDPETARSGASGRGYKLTA